MAEATSVEAFALPPLMLVELVPRSLPGGGLRTAGELNSSVDKSGLRLVAEENLDGVGT